MDAFLPLDATGGALNKTLQWQSRSEPGGQQTHMKQRGEEGFGEEFNSSPRVLITLFPQIDMQT
ncbi:hypothetical protein D623_10008043 [Myotis brandtii]|uniref:Uncharacterized protein n=1 Tax=Myotis brandtii TaxID=109478 RepID=S7Q076_MYOBR|nr:hypothetical protein D623_10008043 [Myotis brandtii]